MKLKRIVLGMVVITLFISLTGCNQQSDKPFTIKETKITHKIIPYESFQSEEFYEEYLKPLMLEVGFKEDNAYLTTCENKSFYVYYSDNSLVETDYNCYGRFEIPNSHYVLGFQYRLSKLTDAKDFHSKKENFPDIVGSAYGCGAHSYYDLIIKLNKKTDTDDGNGAYGGAYGWRVFSDFASFDGISEQDTYSGYDPTCYIFSQKHTTDEIYEKLWEYFDSPDVKEKLLIEKQANSNH